VKRSIPIAAAKRIAEEYGFDQVVIFARKVDTEPGLGDGGEHVTTYGKSVADCDVAARMGNHLKRVIGWPESKCQDKPARVRRREAVPPIVDARARSTRTHDL
jgi:hypothetical protein